MCVFRWIRRPRDLCIQSGKVSERQAQYAALNTHSYAYTRSCEVCCLGRDTRHVIAGATPVGSSPPLPFPLLSSPVLLPAPPLPSTTLLSTALLRILCVVVQGEGVVPFQRSVVAPLRSSTTPPSCSRVTVRWPNLTEPCQEGASLVSKSQTL